MSQSLENTQIITNKPIFLRGKKTILRPIRMEDAEKCCVWVNDPEVAELFAPMHAPVTIDQELEVLKRWAKSEDEVMLAIETLDGQFIGTMGIRSINWHTRIATTGALIGEKEYWGRGFGTDAKMTLLNHAFNAMNLRKIKSAVYSFNERSLRYSLHCGYKVEGRRRKEIFKSGRYWDIIDLGLFKKGWLPIWQRYQETGSVK
jgi:RimJ/RimL family protein N-acetyltransferase